LGKEKKRTRGSQPRGKQKPREGLTALGGKKKEGGLRGKTVREPASNDVRGGKTKSTGAKNHCWERKRGKNVGTTKRTRVAGKLHTRRRGKKRKTTVKLFEVRYTHERRERARAYNKKPNGGPEPERETQEGRFPTAIEFSKRTRKMGTEGNSTTEKKGERSAHTS